MKKIPPLTIERLCAVYGALRCHQQNGVGVVYSNELGKLLGVTDYTIRKDLSYIHTDCTSGRGYDVEGLRDNIRQALKLRPKKKVCVVGLGRLGAALLDYGRFLDADIVAGFDQSLNRIELLETSVDLFSVYRLKEVVRERNIEVGVVAVPDHAAQEVTDLLVDAGVRGILNFAPTNVIVPDGVFRKNMDFANALREIVARIGFGG